MRHHWPVTPSARGSLQDRFLRLWADPASPPDVFSFLADHPEATAAERADVVLLDQQQRQRIGRLLPVEEYLARVPEIAEAGDTKLNLILREFFYREGSDVESFLARFSEFAPDLSERFAARLLETRQELDGGLEPRGRELAPLDARTPAGHGRSPSPVPTDVPHPPNFGRYRVTGCLGEGGFGRVYAGYDEKLDRTVAIKVSHAHLVSSTDGVDAFLAEARILARLDHTGIVPVYDAGMTEDGHCYLVEKLIDGTDLATRIASVRLSHHEAASLVASVADALHHVHGRGLVHRDIKPANILIDTTGTPIVTDFGLALKAEDAGKRISLAGTVQYMSPEQARNEGHLVDGRSDIFSLGVVLYEVLTGTLPFSGDGRTELIERICTLEPRPPRQIDESIPPDLERVCLKALSKRASDRYSTAREMADDLRHYLAHREGTLASSDAGLAASDSIRGIVPKGLRSFDRDDAYFFLQLLPEPRDRDGLPDVIRFWRCRIEELDPDTPFRVGLIYGPSGCGKSSLVKAGLLPRLGVHIRTLCVEAADGDLEFRLLRGLRRLCPSLSPELTLVEALFDLRQRRFLPARQKVLIVIDQFEHWLHTERSLETAGLVRALRQCDGEHVQCIVVVRDDFWMAVTRFMRELEIPLVEGDNSYAVDLFDVRHARKVLTAFGRAYGALPEPPGEMTEDQEEFLDQAVAELAENGKVIPVRLAVFAEMFKRKTWSRSALKEVGGPLGVGVEFLEETFSTHSSPLAHRRHQRAARSVLAALLPEEDIDIRGPMRCRRELLEISGYDRRPRDFDELMRILDSELRLLTPADPDAVESGKERDLPCYQLTHDYLVPSLRHWLTRKQRETPRGRAEIRLAERTSLWSTIRERKQLPSWWEWLNILLFTRTSRWTPAQRRMMRAAGKLQVIRALVLLAILITLVGLGFWGESLWRDWKVEGWVREAELAWRRGKDRWPEACGLVEKAYQAAPHHPEVERLLRRISSEGTLLIETLPADAEIEVTPRPGEDRTLGHPLHPALIGFQPGVRFRPRDRIPLKLGHYWVTVRAGSRSCGFPVFIGQIQYEDSGEQWREGERLLSEDAAVWKPAWQKAPNLFKLAEERVIRPLVLVEVPPGRRYVPPGPAWCSEPVRRSEWEGLEVKDGNALVQSVQSRLVSCELAIGFLIGESEVTVGEFREWLKRDRQRCRDWNLRNKVRRFLIHAERAPEAIRTWWQDHKEEEYHSSKSAWEGYLARLENALAHRGANLPVTGVHWTVALTYTRSHAPVVAGELGAWLALRIQEIEAVLQALNDQVPLIQGMAAAPARVEDLPGALRELELWQPGDYLSDLGWQTALESYSSWLQGAVDFAQRIPEKLLERHPRYVRLLESFEHDLEDDRTIDPKNLIRWLSVQIDQLGRRRAALEKQLQKLPGLPSTAEVPAEAMGWDIRLEYGFDRGYGLPSSRQWEKAFRGADSRRYPWGYRTSGGEAWLGPGREGPRSVDSIGDPKKDQDRSPYRVRGLGGNASEWLMAKEGQPDYFAKGGNFRYSPGYGDGGHSFAIRIGTAPDWVGFRVVREIYPPGHYKRWHLAKNPTTVTE